MKAIAVLLFPFVVLASDPPSPVEPVTSKAPVDREEIRQAVRDNLRDIQQCYEKPLKRDPKLGSGKVVLNWTVGEGGKVIRAKVHSSELRDAEVGKCMVNVILKAKFPEPPAKEEVEVSYPFFFAP